MAGNKIKELKQISKELRVDVVESLANAGSGHIAGSLGLTDIFTTLYFSTLKTDPKKPNWKERDYLIVSNGHICPILYASLAKKGFFKREELFNLRQINSFLQGHPHNNIPGVENSSGPLAQGISFGVGVALALKMDSQKNQVFVTCGDGELDEGECWEAFMSANKFKLDNFTLIIDYNKIQLDGNIKEVMPLGNLKTKLKSFGFEVFEVDGNSIEKLIDVFKNSKKIKNKPKAIIARTTPGKGVSFIENDYHWHGKVLTGKNLNKALNELIE